MNKTVGLDSHTHVQSLFSFSFFYFLLKILCPLVIVFSSVLSSVVSAAVSLQIFTDQLWCLKQRLCLIVIRREQLALHALLKILAVICECESERTRSVSVIPAVDIFTLQLFSVCILTLLRVNTPLDLHCKNISHSEQCTNRDSWPSGAPIGPDLLCVVVSWFCRGRFYHFVLSHCHQTFDLFFIFSFNSAFKNFASNIKILCLCLSHLQVLQRSFVILQLSLLVLDLCLPLPLLLRHEGKLSQILQLLSVSKHLLTANTYCLWCFD